MSSRQPAPARPKRKGGGQPGNKNAFKHGFYSRHYSADEKKRLPKTRQDLLDEIAHLRIWLDRLSSSLDGKQEFSEREITMLKILISISVSIATLMRSQSFLTGKPDDVERDLQDAILSQAERWILA